MPEPQLEDGYTRLANELFEAIIRHNFSKREYKIMLAVIRRTYGYGKKTDDISLSQLANMTGLTSAHVSETINSLVDKKVFLKREGQHAQNIGLNKNYGLWKGSQNGNIPKTGIKGSQNGNKGVPKTGTTKENSKRNTKETYARFEKFYSEYPKKKSKESALKAFLKINPDEQLLQTMLDAVRRAKTQDDWIKDNGQFVPYPATWLNQKRWEDETTATVIDFERGAI